MQISTATSPSTSFFHFGDTTAGDHFDPRPDATITVRVGLISNTVAWPATATIDTLDDSGITWHESLPAGDPSNEFSAGVSLQQVGDDVQSHIQVTPGAVVDGFPLWMNNINQEVHVTSRGPNFFEGSGPGGAHVRVDFTPYDPALGIPAGVTDAARAGTYKGTMHILMEKNMGLLGAFRMDKTGDVYTPR